MPAYLLPLFLGRLSSGLSRSLRVFRGHGPPAGPDCSAAVRPLQDDEDISGALGPLPDDRGQPCPGLFIEKALGLDAEGLGGRHQAAVATGEATDVRVRAIPAGLEDLQDLRFGEPNRPQHCWRCSC